MIRIIIVGLLCFLSFSAKANCNKTPDRPYELGECWTKRGNSWTVTGRKPVPIFWKLNPLWWFGNDYEPVAPSWYMPGKTSWVRNADWYVRNPFQNAGNYVFGVKDLNYTATWIRGPVGQTSMADIGKTGCIVIKLHGGDLWYPRYYWSCTGKRLMWYAGTPWYGFFGFKFNILNSKVQVF